MYLHMDQDIKHSDSLRYNFVKQLEIKLHVENILETLKLTTTFVCNCWACKPLHMCSHVWRPEVCINLAVQ